MKRTATVVHIVAKIGSDEVVSCYGMVGQVLAEFRERAYVRYAVNRVRLPPVGDVIEVHERIVFHRVGIAVGKRAFLSRNILLVGPPLDSSPGRILQKRHQMLGGGLAVG